MSYIDLNVCEKIELVKKNNSQQSILQEKNKGNYDRQEVKSLLEVVSLIDKLCEDYVSLLYIRACELSNISFDEILKSRIRKKLDLMKKYGGLEYEEFVEKYGLEDWKLDLLNNGRGWSDKFKKLYAKIVDEYRIFHTKTLPEYRETFKRDDILDAICQFYSSIAPEKNEVWHPYGMGTRALDKDEEWIKNEAEARARSAEQVYIPLVKRLEDKLKSEILEKNEIKAITEKIVDLKENCDEKIIRRRIRAKAKKARQFWQSALGAAGHNNPYCSNFSLNAYKDRISRSDQFLSSKYIELENGLGETKEITLKEIADHGKKAKISQINSIMAGIDGIAKRKDLNLIAVMVTLTLPPAYHSNPRSGFKTRSWTPDHGPVQAHRELQDRWARFRSLLWKKKIETLGIRVLEPHKDGTPHLHAVLYVPKNMIRYIWHCVKVVCPVDEILKHYPKKSWGRVRRGARNLKIIDRKPGRKAPAKCYHEAKHNPVAYALKYVKKGLAPQPGDKIALKVKAQLSEMGARSFAICGIRSCLKIWQCLAIWGRSGIYQLSENMRKIANLIDGRQYTDALLSIGVLGRRNNMLLQNLYDENTTNNGRVYKKWVGIYDNQDGEVTLKNKYDIKNVDKTINSGEVTVNSNYPSVSLNEIKKLPKNERRSIIKELCCGIKT